LIGIYFGWIYTPQSISGTSLSALRSDYHADYVLMVAESYQSNSSTVLAAYQLAYLGDDEPLRYVQQAIIDAEQLNFSAADIDILANLAGAFQGAQATITPPVATVTP